LADAGHTFLIDVHKSFVASTGISALKNIMRASIIRVKPLPPVPGHLHLMDPVLAAPSARNLGHDLIAENHAL
jgi:hypothetical protein